MPRIHAKSVLYMVDEFDFSGVSNRATLDFTNNVAPVTAYADVHATYVEGKTGFTFQVDGLIDLAAGGYDAEMFTDLTATGRRVGIIPGGGTAGNYGYEALTNTSQQPRPAEVSGAVLLNVTWRGDTPAVRVVLLQKVAALSSTASSSKVQYGAAAATDTIVSTLRLLSAPGGAGNNDLDVTIESDADSSAGGETTRLTHTTLNQASVATHEVVTAAGAVTDAWWRAVATISGAGSRTFDLVLTFGIRPT